VTAAEKPSAESAVLAEDLDGLVRELTLEEKVQLLTGRDFWTTWPIERIGLRSIVSCGNVGALPEVIKAHDVGVCRARLCWVAEAPCSCC